MRRIETDVDTIKTIFEFGEVAYCPKCRHYTDRAGVKWDQYYNERLGKWFEILVRTCSRCSYIWWEDCADHQAAPSKPPPPEQLAEAEVEALLR